MPSPRPSAPELVPLSRLDGSPLVADAAWLPDLVVCRPELAARVLAALRPAA